MITNIIRYHTAIYYIMPTIRDRLRPYWISSGERKKTLNDKHAEKEQTSHGVQKKDAI